MATGGDADCEMKEANRDVFIISLLFNLVATRPVCKDIWKQIDDFSQMFKLRPTIHVGSGTVGPTIMFVYLVSGAERDGMNLSATQTWNSRFNGNSKLRGVKYFKDKSLRDFEGMSKQYRMREISDVQFRNGLTDWGFSDHILAVYNKKNQAIIRQRYRDYIAYNTDMPADRLEEYIRETTNHNKPSVEYGADGEPVVHVN